LEAARRIPENALPPTDRSKEKPTQAEAIPRRCLFPEMPKWQRAMEEMFGELAADKTAGAHDGPDRQCGEARKRLSDAR
jgi:hypothetical protein